MRSALNLISFVRNRLALIARFPTRLICLALTWAALGLGMLVVEVRQNWLLLAGRQLLSSTTKTSSRLGGWPERLVAWPLG